MQRNRQVVRGAYVKLRLAVALIAPLVLAGTSAGQQYSIIDLGTLPGTSQSRALGLNNSGQVVGFSGSAPNSIGFIWQDGGMQSLGVLPGDTTSIGRAINDSSVVTGSSGVFGCGIQEAFVWSNDQMVGLPFPPSCTPDGDNLAAGQGINELSLIVGWSGADFCGEAGPDDAVLWDGLVAERLTRCVFTYAYDINELEDIVGEAFFPPGFRAFLIQRDLILDLGSLQGPALGESLARAVNNKTQIVGWSDTDDGLTRAFRWDSGRMIDLGGLEASGHSEAYDINASSVIVGTATTFGSDHAFLYVDDRKGMQDLNDFLPPGSLWDPLEVASSINNSGQIAGWGIIDGERHAFSMSPVAACMWDLANDDGIVDARDLATLLGHWGNPYGPVELANLLGAWGPCP